ncbi:hypothetical protein [Desulfuromonas sp.]|nr:hypothetical protein [Desulfuromonas sp.]
METLPPRILATHLKPLFREAIAAEVRALGIPQMELAEDGAVYEL